MKMRQIQIIERPSERFMRMMGNALDRMHNNATKRKMSYAALIEAANFLVQVGENEFGEEVYE